MQKRWKWTQHWLCLASEVSEDALLAFFSLCCQFCKHFTPFVVWLGNAIGDAGVRHLADMLKVNTTLVSLDLSSAFCLHLCCWYVYDCVCCDIDNQIGEEYYGFRAIAEALKVNSTLLDINLERERSISCMFFVHFSPIREQDLK